jgi:DNA primase
MDIKVATLPAGLDPADAILKDKNIWGHALKHASHIIEFCTDVVMKTTTDPRVRDRKIVEEVLPFVAVLKSATEQSRFVSLIAHKTSSREEALWSDVRRSKPEAILGDMVQPVRQEKEPIRRDGVEIALRRLYGIIAWQQDSGGTYDIATLEKRIADADPKALAQFQSLTQERAELALETELYYGDTGILERDISQLVDAVQKDRWRREFKEAKSALAKAEATHDKKQVEALLVRCQEIGRFLSSGPPDQGSL